MRRGGLLLIIGLLLLAVVVVIMILGNQGGGGILGPSRQPTSTPSATVVTKEMVAASLDTIPRGGVISEEMLTSVERPAADVRTGRAVRFEDAVEQLVGRTAAVEIKPGQVIKPSDVVSIPDYLHGSLTSLYIPSGSVAVAFPADRLTSVGYAVQPGDRVDVIATFLVVDVDPQFQTILPNYTLLLAPDGTAALRDIPIGVEGTLPASHQPVNVIPNPKDPSQRPRAVTQLTLQNVLVVKLGEWSTSYMPTAVPTAEVATPVGTPRAGTGASGQQVQQVQPTPTLVPRPDIVTVALPRQDALVLMYLLHTGASVEFALRPAGDTNTDYAPEPVTLYYVFQTFRIPEPPPALPYATEPGLWPLDLIPTESANPMFLTPMPHPNPTWESQ